MNLCLSNWHVQTCSYVIEQCGPRNKGDPKTCRVYYPIWINLNRVCGVSCALAAYFHFHLGPILSCHTRSTSVTTTPRTQRIRLLSKSLSENDVPAIIALFTDDGNRKDILALTWGLCIMASRDIRHAYARLVYSALIEHRPPSRCIPRTDTTEIPAISRLYFMDWDKG